MTLVMTYLFWSVLVAAIGASPILIAGVLTGRFFAHLAWFLFVGIVYFILTACQFYVYMPASSIPYYGMLFEIAVFTIIAFGMSMRSYEDSGWWKFLGATLVPIGAFSFMFGNWLINQSVFFNDHKYARLLGKVEDRVWSTDIQPLATDRALLVAQGAAYFSGSKSVGILDTLGSQFVLREENFALQKIDGRLQHVVPLDFRSFFTWLNTNGVPAYMIIDGHDPSIQAQVIRIGNESNYFKYTLGAYWTGYLDRHLRLSGLTHEKFLDRHMELDDDKKPWWVVTLGVPTIWATGDVVTGVAIVNPATGTFQKYALKDVPQWVDRVFPDSLVKNNIAWHGYYNRGWENALWVGKDTYEPEDVVLQFTHDGRATFVTGTTSTSMADDSLITLMYTDTRTGSHVRYKMKGGATVSAIRKLIETHPDANVRRAHADTIHYINESGVETAMAPLTVNDTNAYYGVAFIPVMNLNAQKLVWHQDIKEAHRKYIASLANEGVNVTVVTTEKIAMARGRVHRVTAPYNNSIGLIVQGVKPIIYGSVTEFPTLRFTQAGDDVEVSFVESDAETTSLRKFYNHSLMQRGGMMPQFYK